VPGLPALDAVVFDLDDTLVDWRTSVHRTASEIAGDDVADRLVAWAVEHAWRRRDGVVIVRDTWQMAEFAETTWPAALPDLDPDDVALLVKRFRAELWIGFFPDVVPALDRLVSSRRLGLLSNNPYVVTEVERLRLGDWFEVVVEVPRDERKPDARAFARACAAMGTEPARTAYVGDSIAYDAEASLAAGLVPIWLDRHDDGWAVPAGVQRITSLTELADLLA
jgi:putative hydrolase of the HAD superfamily